MKIKGLFPISVEHPQLSREFRFELIDAEVDYVPSCELSGSGRVSAKWYDG